MTIIGEDLILQVSKLVHIIKAHLKLKTQHFAASIFLRMHIYVLAVLSKYFKVLSDIGKIDYRFCRTEQNCVGPNFLILPVVKLC